MLKYKIPQIVTLIRKLANRGNPLTRFYIAPYFWINPPKSLIYSKKRGKSLLKFLFLLGD